MKPYKNLNSKNLGLLLLLARVVAVLGIISIVLTLLVFAYMTYSSGLFGLTRSLSFIPMSVSILLISGLMAAIVAFEENYRIRTEHLVNGNKISLS
ncbi:hypothetical protein [Pleionea mediterranea]|uniref:Uncharacterized protein n=1 Tax=Pleionea mediterranea TaxID=523701 RepID=A0A316FBT5_9GAMM|nr:hypothetical protein [Pleionea mediterranea]PWK46341.1 hypothetical protein C8D97_11324 [Pleionea mediterranea]